MNFFLVSKKYYIKDGNSSMIYNHSAIQNKTTLQARESYTTPNYIGMIQIYYICRGWKDIFPLFSLSEVKQLNSTIRPMSPLATTNSLRDAITNLLLVLYIKCLEVGCSWSSGVLDGLETVNILQRQEAHARNWW